MRLRMTTLHHARLESLALSIIARVSAGRPVEDARVELKREWIDPQKAARRLAGHSNAARGAEVLWIVGVDESTGIAGANSAELANWWPAVQACFDGVSPSLTDLVLHVDGLTLCLLAFGTERAPYVVKNPLFGSTGSGPISLEVPWREGTKVRSATRNDLLKLLTSAASVPDLEPMDGRATMRINRHNLTQKPTVSLSISSWLYLTPRGDTSTTIPFHRCTCTLRGADGSQTIDGFEVSMNRPWQYGGKGNSRPDTATMERTSSELIAHGPGKCEFTASTEFAEVPSWLVRSTFTLFITLSVVDADLPLAFALRGIPKDPGPDNLAIWRMEPDA